MMIDFSIVWLQAVIGMSSDFAFSSSASAVSDLSADEKETSDDWRVSRKSTPRPYDEAEAWINKTAHQERHQDSKARSSRKKSLFKLGRWKFSKDISADIVKEELRVLTFPNSMTKMSKERRLQVFFLHDSQLGATSRRMPSDVTSLVTICRRTVTLRWRVWTYGRVCSPVEFFVSWIRTSVSHVTISASTSTKT